MSAMEQMQAGLPSPRKLFTPGVTGILILSLAGFLVFVLNRDFAVSVLGLSASGVLRGRVWQLVTYPFVYSSPMNLVFSGMVVLFVGSVIEREWRTASFVWLWLVVSVSCGILWVLVGRLANAGAVGMGATACSYGFISTMGLLYRGRRFFVFFATVEAQHLAVGLVIVGIILNIMTPIALVWIAGAPVAYIYVKMRWSRGVREAARPISRQAGGGGRFVDLD